MALDVTPAGATADSYLSVAGADALAGADVGRAAESWAATNDTPKKERHLRRATRDIDWHVRYVSSQYAPGIQALLFPRSGDLNALGTLPVILRSVELATYAQAIFLWANASVLDDADTRRARGLRSFATPNVSGEVDYNATHRLSARAVGYLEGIDAGAVVGWIAAT